MVKRATIHVSSRTKMNHPKNEGIREVKKRQQIQPVLYFTTKLPLQESWLQYCPREAVVLVVYLAEGLYTRVACFVLAKRCYLL